MRHIEAIFRGVLKRLFTQCNFLFWAHVFWGKFSIFFLDFFTYGNTFVWHLLSLFTPHLHHLCTYVVFWECFIILFFKAWRPRPGGGLLPPGNWNLGKLFIIEFSSFTFEILVKNVNSAVGNFQSNIHFYFEVLKYMDMLLYVIIYKHLHSFWLSIKNKFDWILHQPDSLGHLKFFGLKKATRKVKSLANFFLMHTKVNFQNSKIKIATTPKRWK